MIKDKQGNSYATYDDIMRDLGYSRPTAFRKIKAIDDKHKAKVQGKTAIPEKYYRWYFENQIDKSTREEEAQILLKKYTPLELALMVSKLNFQIQILENKNYYENL
ncbi:hypothetical protein CJP45_16265 [Lactobacillus plantarum]|jgi:hypothetical protein|uniref:hypothetical protein n=1 Tax=Lactiplantibacillus plantarum TaxID=1590 RepID=UPI00136B4161|nr:hypothetical protein [Lactiplantibacillus plantarum]MCG0656750.1 hypothetical protein [Lactiplantibacillus plantarum]MZV33553.1 hypothetical protein [Lactiplantibacillus plantarum]MZV53872.1 hypothetical protein [Lactiplantibacillus plantarum]MZV61696.1 hypothetical protein [Lactiplantibacillus plantarum]QHS21410.1 hypothetical protein GWD03_15755 [Lactiplantibacillus plantarum]